MGKLIGVGSRNVEESTVDDGRSLRDQDGKIWTVDRDAGGVKQVGIPMD